MALRGSTLQERMRMPHTIKVCSRSCHNLKSIADVVGESTASQTLLLQLLECSDSCEKDSRNNGSMSELFRMKCIVEHAGLHVLKH